MALLSILRSLVVVTLAALFAMSASAQQFPSKPIRIVVGYGAGGATDTIARIYAEKLQGVLNTPVIVENKAGAFESIAAQTVLSAPPDGHTLWLGTAGALTMGPGVRPNTSYDVLKGFTHVAKIAEVEAFLCVANNVPANSLGELLAYAKANPGKLFYTSGGVGSGSHLLVEYIMNVTGTSFVHVPYKSDAEVSQQLAAGTVQMAFVTSLASVPFINDRKFKAIAVTGSQRMKVLPNVPTVAETEGLKSVGVFSIFGLLGPAGMPPAVTQKLSDAFNQVARMPEVVQRLDGLSTRATTSTPAELRQYIESEHGKWQELGKKLKINFN